VFSTSNLIKGHETSAELIRQPALDLCIYVQHRESERRHRKCVKKECAYVKKVAHIHVFIFSLTNGVGGPVYLDGARTLSLAQRLEMLGRLLHINPLSRLRRARLQINARLEILFIK
jgi:hypothetical protein